MECDHSAAVCVESTGGIEAGAFEEVYRCPQCKATGTITGEASDPPETWNRTGRVFA